MARKRMNLGMVFALAVGGFYLFRQYKAKQAAVALAAPAVTISSGVVQSTAGPVS